MVNSHIITGGGSGEDREEEAGGDSGLTDQVPSTQSGAGGVALRELTPQFRSINYSALSFLYGPTLISMHDHWKNHNPD